MRDLRRLSGTGAPAAADLIGDYAAALGVDEPAVADLHELVAAIRS